MLYEHTNGDLLLPYLRSHLPYSLPVYNCLISTSSLSHPISIYASFPASIDPTLDEVVSPWLIFVNLGPQLRSFCSHDGDDSAALTEGFPKAAALVVDCCREFVTGHHQEFPGVPVKFGGMPSIYIPELAKELKTLSFVTFPSCIHLAPEVTSLEEIVALPPDFVLRTGEECDLDEIVSTLEVPHTKSYLRSRLPHSTVLLLQTDDSKYQLIGHCFTHLDGSIGTLFIHPSHRQKGFAKVVMEERMRQEANGPGPVRRSYSCVGRYNLESTAVMKKLGWEESWDCAWVGIALEDL